MSVADSEWPVVGATGARFGSARSRQRRNSAGAELAQRGRPSGEVDHGSVSGQTRVVGGIPERRAAMSGTDRGSEIDVGNEDMDQPETSSFVRPFVRIGGRTRAEVELPLEALVSAVPSAQGIERGFALEEHRTVLALCVQPRSIMEVAALAGIPLGGCPSSGGRSRRHRRTHGASHGRSGRARVSICSNAYSSACTGSDVRRSGRPRPVTPCVRRQSECR